MKRALFTFAIAGSLVAQTAQPSGGTNVIGHTASTSAPAVGVYDLLGVSGLIDPSVKYVSKTGNDANDGSSWQKSKLTIASAVASLPHFGTLGSGGYHYGVVNIGPGTFVEAGNLELNQSIAYLGAQIGLLGTTGTTVRLANNANVPLFSYTPDWITSQAQNPDPTAYSHNVVMNYLSLDGNRAYNTGTANLLQLSGGGFNTSFTQVNFSNSSNFGLYIYQKAVNFSCYTCTFAQNTNSAVYADENEGNSIISFYDLQMDDSGQDAFWIHGSTNNDYSGAGTYTFVNLKSEGHSGTLMKHVIRHDAPNVQGYPASITVVAGTAFQSGSGGESFAYESAGSVGSEARWHMMNVSATSGYTNGFYSAKSGLTSHSNWLNDFLSVDQTPSLVTNQYGSKIGCSTGSYEPPDVELSGGLTVQGGTASPQGVICARPGSLFLDSATPALWIKSTAATSNTGWLKVPAS